MKAVKCVFLFLLISLSLVRVCFAAEKTADAGALNNKDKIQLTKAEVDFIAKHPVINLGVDPTFIPYEFIDTDGVYKGIAADYIELICQKTGLKMSVAKGLTWSEAYEKAAEKKLDVLPCVSKTKLREQYFIFSDPYFTFQRAIFIKDDNNSIGSFQDLIGKTVAVQANSSHHTFLLDYDSIKLSLYKTVEEGLYAVSNGTETAFVGNLATSNYLIKSYGITNLKYVILDSEEPQSLYFAVRNDWPELTGILNKALAGIKKEEKIAINNKWLGVEESADYSGIIRTAVITGAVIAIVLAVSFFWIMRLRKEILKRKKAQEELHAAKEEAERANQTKFLFLARMSHEIRTPLNAIMGMSYLLKKTGLNTTQGIHLEKLTQAARNMLGIINDILDFSKIEAGKIAIEKVSFDLDSVLQRVINIISVNVEEQGIEFTVDKEPDMPAFFWGDPVRIEQILLNLVNNAVKFTSKGSVSLTVKTLSKRNDTYDVEFCVKDTGIGMDEEQLKQLFIPFNQGDLSINRRFGGTGLGLSIVKNLLDLMGGEIKVESAVNEGSAFTIRLPLPVGPDEKQKEAEKKASGTFGDIRALVLDESENTRTLLAGCFKSYGIDAAFSSSDEDAFRLMREAAENGRPYNLLIVDHLAPKGGGIEFYKAVKKSFISAKPLKYMLMIPMSKEYLVEAAEAAGIDFAFVKPVIPSVLFNGIIGIFGIRPSMPSETPEKECTPVAPYPYHILLVEDNNTNQFIAKSILEQAGFRVSAAGNGQEGYDFFLNNRGDLDLILMDIHMPMMDGYTASSLIRKIDPHIPIIAMTADAIGGVVEKCKSHGMSDYVCKPFEPEQFIAAILAALKDSKRYAAEEAGQGRYGQNETEGSDAPALDISDGIKRVGGDDQVYRMVLQAYYDENKSAGTELKERIELGDYPGAAQVVHKIKSSSGNIGAKSLFEAASELQKSLHDGDEAGITERLVGFQTMLRKVLKEIEHHLKIAETS